MKSIMLYTSILILLSIFLLPARLYLKGQDKGISATEVHYQIVIPSFPEKKMDKETSVKDSALLENESIELEDWMLDLTEWQVNERKSSNEKTINK
jgi:hypothetical protein